MYGQSWPTAIPGESILEMISNAGFDIFLDLKLHDIPNTVSKALSEIEKFNVLMTTIHLQGGKEMIEAALSSVHSTKNNRSNIAYQSK